MDANETPEQAAQRELLEETGYAEYNGYWIDPDAYSAGSAIVLWLLNVKKCRAQPDANEFLEPVELSPTSSETYVVVTTDVEVGYLGLDYLGLLK